MIQSTSPGRFLALPQGETDSRASCVSKGASKKAARRHEGMLLLISVCILLLMSLSLSLKMITTSAASSPLTVIRAAPRPSRSPSPTVTIKGVPRSATVEGETTATPLTFVDLVSTIVAALIPALLGGMFIVASRRSLRKRERPEWSGQAFLIQEREQMDWQGEVEAVDSFAKEQEEQRDGAEDNDPQLVLLSTPVTDELAHSRLSRLKCRLRSLPEPLPAE